MPCTRRARLPMYSFCGPSKDMALRLGAALWPLRSTGMKLVMGTELIVCGSPLSPVVKAPVLALVEWLTELSGVPELLLRSLRQEER